MGVSFDRDLRIAGYRPTVFKNALAGFMRTNNPAAMVDFKSVFPNRRDGAIVFEECLDRGLIAHDEDGHWKVTEAGEAMVVGKASRANYASAKNVLDEFLARAEAMNGSPSAIAQVDQVWLFGSFMRGEQTVGDIDLAVALSPAQRFAGGREGRRMSMAHAEAVLRAYGLSLPGIYATLGSEGRLTQLLLFGKRRHPLLAGAHLEVEDLISLGAPCKLIFDRSRGGRVDDPVLARHPDSPGRANDMNEPRRLPSLAPQTPLRPMDARWLTEYDDGWKVSPCDIFRSWTDEARQLFPSYPWGLSVMAKEPRDGRAEWVPSLVRDADPAGRARVVLLHHPADDRFERSPGIRRGVAALIERSIIDDGSSITVKTKFADVETWRGHKRIDFFGTLWLTRAAAFLAAVDCERALRRAVEAGQPKPVKLVVEDDVGGGFGAWMGDTLRGDVRLSPPEWSGSAPEIEVVGV